MRRGHGAGVGLDERPAPEADAVLVAPGPEPLRTEFAFELKPDESIPRFR